MEEESIFDHTVELPDSTFKQKGIGLIGFEKRFQQVFANLRQLLAPDELEAWSLKHHQKLLPAIVSLAARYPLIILEGDAGTGKTISAEVIADRMAREMKKDAVFIRLSTRVRGQGLHGQMAQLVNDAFSQLKKLAGKQKLAFLLIDEADAIATSRSTEQMHQEEKAAVNTLIQKIDETRELKGRSIVFLSTNRLRLLDEAIVRRAALVMKFERPDEVERQELFKQELDGITLTDKQLTELATLTGPEANNGVGYSFSDLRLRLIPVAVALAFPNNPLTFQTLKDAVSTTQPSPAIK
jgi:SpoVK/Ycf46/Vps4 family AAA+-type ATPase